MQRTVVIALIVIVLMALFFIFNPLQDENPPQQTGVITPFVDEKTQGEARRHITQLTKGNKEAIDIKQADNFVTADQLINLPERTVQSTADIISEEPVASTPTSNQDNATFAIDPRGFSVKPQPSVQKQIQATTLPSLANQVTLKELLDNPDQSGKKVFFIHAVQDSDDEGLWGIIQHGLMRTFTEGIQLPGLEKRVFADIPKQADERLADKRSSFLGHILQNKVNRTYIYNYEKGILGDNPNLIQPGQQLVVVTFTEDELISIYNHFVNLQE